MEKKKEQIESKLKNLKTVQSEDQEMKEVESSSEDDEITEFIDWRAKKSHK